MEEKEEKDLQTESNENQMITLSENELRSLMNEVQDETIKTTLMTIEQSEQFSGPLPHPEHMQQYKEIDESFPNRIVSMAESNLSHKQFIEKFTVAGQLFMGFLGWATPTGIAFFVLFYAVQFIKEGKSIEALIALVTALATLGGAFYLKGKNKDT